MRTLSKIIATALVATTALGAALPAQAQPYPGRHERFDRWDDRWDNRFYDQRDYSQSIRAQIEDLQRRVERNDWRDRISEREAAALRRDIWRLRQQYRDYARNGLSQREAQILHEQVRDVRQRLRYERRDRDGRRW
jgi:Spy/CpxP family protein refolding chaperone